ncbi:hypothetical protein B6J19_26240 [Klebsiella quasipneumoniae]|nr:hypothetical protein B6J19_26240 [Klebsiella quasipneumoniae]
MVGYRQTNQKTDTGKTLTRWPVFVDHFKPESEGATVDESFVVGGPVGDSELLLCHGMVCVVGRMRDLILQLSKSSIYSTKP